MLPFDATITAPCVFSCPCGQLFAARRVLFVDLQAAPECVARLRERGSFEGQCPSCAAPALAFAPWVELDPRSRRAWLVVGADRRGEVVDLLAEHLQRIQARPELGLAWVLHPEIRWLERGPGAERVGSVVEHEPERESTVRTPAPTQAPTAARSAQTRGMGTGDAERARSAAAGVLRGPDAPGRVPGPGVPQPIGREVLAPGLVLPPTLGAWPGTLALVANRVRLTAEFPTDMFARWSEVQLQARPVLLRGRGYPLLGVRVVGAWMGQTGCIDGIVDVGRPEAIEIFRALSQGFAIELELRSPETSMGRQVSAPALSANAALCLESARVALAQGDHPPERFFAALDNLAREGADQRLAPSPENLVPGSYLHIVGAREAQAAVEHLDRVTRKETLARLLEVDALPMAEYDAIRRRVLAGALEHGVVVPRRFWRRVVASGLAEDLSDYVVKLATNRELHAGEEGDLDPAATRAAWEAILDICVSKGLRPPEILRRALQLPESLAEPQGLTPVGGTPPPVPTEREESTLVVRLADPQTRLRTASQLLQGGRTGPTELAVLFAALERFGPDELLALLPDLSDLGSRAVPSLVAKLHSDRREVRQVATILLGLSLDPRALDPLVDALLREPTHLWTDVARALGGFGALGLDPLCRALQADGGPAGTSETAQRVSRAFAEIALSGGPAKDRRPHLGQEGVATLAQASDPRVCAAARRALATLRDVSESGAAFRGERGLGEVTEIRAFSRRAYEAITVPEFEVEAEGG